MQSEAGNFVLQGRTVTQSDCVILFGDWSNNNTLEVEGRPVRTFSTVYTHTQSHTPSRHLFGGTHAFFHASNLSFLAERNAPVYTHLVQCFARSPARSRTTSRAPHQEARWSMGSTSGVSPLPAGNGARGGGRC